MQGRRPNLRRGPVPTHDWDAAHENREADKWVHADVSVTDFGIWCPFVYVSVRRLVLHDIISANVKKPSDALAKVGYDADESFPPIFKQLPATSIDKFVKEVQRKSVALRCVDQSRVLCLSKFFLHKFCSIVDVRVFSFVRDVSGSFFIHFVPLDVRVLRFQMTLADKKHFTSIS